MKKKLLIVLGVLTVAFTIMGATLAYWNWTSSSNTLVTFTVTSNFSCSADGGGDITSSDVMLAPASCTNETYAIKREITVNLTTNGSIWMDLWLNVNSIGEHLADTQYFKYALTRYIWWECLIALVLTLFVTGATVIVWNNTGRDEEDN